MEEQECEEDNRILKVLPLSELTPKELVKAMCALRYRFVANISKADYTTCKGKFNELASEMDEDVYDGYEFFLCVSLAFDLDYKVSEEYYGLWAKKGYAKKNIRLGWTPDFCL